MRAKAFKEVHHKKRIEKRQAKRASARKQKATKAGLRASAISDARKPSAQRKQWTPTLVAAPAVRTAITVDFAAAAKALIAARGEKAA